MYLIIQSKNKKIAFFKLINYIKKTKMYHTFSLFIFIICFVFKPYLLSLSLIAACAAARRAIGTLYGLHET